MDAKKPPQGVIIASEFTNRQPDLIGDRAFGRERGRKAQLVEWVGVAERANRHLVRRDGWSGTDHDNISLSGESGARQDEKLCQIAHPIGANLAPAFTVLAVSGRRPGIAGGVNRAACAAE